MNFNKIANKPITYHVHPENRIVVAVMHNTEDIAYDYLLKTHRPSGGVFVHPLLLPASKRIPYLTMSEKYVAKVYCHPDDEFDVETGMRLAEKKLMKNVYDAFSKRIRRYSKQLAEYSNALAADMDRLDKENCQ